MSAFLDKRVHEPYLISFVIGVLSSCVDNVALVAATMGMYPIVPDAANLAPYAQFFVSDGGFWTFLAYCAVTGGSILIIGSATGVTVMGLEKIDFMYYTKRFSILALIGYCCGAGVYMLLLHKFYLYEKNMDFDGSLCHYAFRSGSLCMHRTAGRKESFG